MRKLVTIRRVSEVNPIEGADSIECLTVEGWKVVSQKGNFQPGDQAVYFEIDSFLPKGSELWDDLVAKSSREYEGRVGHVLRTIKLRGQVSQGWCIPLATMFKYFPEFEAKFNALGDQQRQAFELRQIDWAETIGVVKYEPPIPAALAGAVKGAFPSFIKKTDQERCQNLAGEIFADLDARYEVSIKLDGSSMTVYHDPEEIGGVCSRNLELNTAAIENDNNTLVKLAKDSGLLERLKQYPSYAVQGELMGPGIQGNREQLKNAQFFVFDIYNMARGEYLSPVERLKFVMDNADVGVGLIHHVPVLYHDVSLRELGFEEIPEATPSHGVVRDENGNVVGAYAGGEDQEPYHARARNIVKLLEMAEGKSLKNDVREGLVFKRLDGKFSFKAISNKFLLKQKE